MAKSSSTKAYPSDLRDEEWALLDPLIPRAKQAGRPEKHAKRAILNAIFYLVRSGCAWRMLPNALPPWKLVWHYIAHWKKQGVWVRLNDTPRDTVRLQAGKKAPTAAILDAQSERTTEQGGVERTFAWLGRSRRLRKTLRAHRLFVRVFCLTLHGQTHASPTRLITFSTRAQKNSIWPVSRS